MSDPRDLLAPQRELRECFTNFRDALERRDSRAAQRALLAFEATLHHRIATELRLLAPALAGNSIAGRDTRRELESRYVQLRELTRHVRERLARDAERGELLGFVENLDRRLTAHANEMERVYYPAAWAALSANARLELARSA